MITERIFKRRSTDNKFIKIYLLSNDDELEQISTDDLAQGSVAHIIGSSTHYNYNEGDDKWEVK